MIGTTIEVWRRRALDSHQQNRQLPAVASTDIVMLARLYIGQRVKYNGHEYQVMNYGPWGVRIESGYGRQHCILVVPAYELQSA